MGNLFYNVHPHVDEDRILAQWVYWKPPAVVVMNNPNLAHRLIEVRPDATVIVREKNAQINDDKIDGLGDPVSWLDYMDSRYHHLNLVYYAGNEIHANSPKVAGWMIDAMKEATARGRRLCILNSGTGGPESEEWWADAPPTAPSTLPAWRYGHLYPVVEHWLNTDHLWGFHEYATELDWRADRGWQVGRFELHLDTWLLAGFQFDRAAIKRRFVFTEATFDSCSDSNHKGARHLSAQAAALQMLAQDVQVYAGTGGVCMYCIGHNSDPQWRLFRLDCGTCGETVGLDEWGATFQAIIEEYMLESQQAGGDTDMDTEWTQKRVIVTTPVNRRVSYGTTARQISGQMLTGDYVLDVGLSLDDGTYQWWQFRETGTNNTWWSASGHSATPNEWLTVTDYAPDPEPEPEPEPDPEEPPFDWHLFQTQQLTVMYAFDQLAEYLAAHLTAERSSTESALSMVNQFRAVLRETIDDMETTFSDDDEQDAPQLAA